ncbi:succinate dehydrogenase assembly factor 2 [Wolbachia endosymbiont of Chironomus riparius]|uniref:succinate dehydrogenase assembly factor 2 n=1 Tax=Wolbachia endosymbiont of Chironomus riparius TaxID=2883238 RepID=UPI0020A0CD1D|nr:succinate dehydrogenase assembly factor 2 [Wolbachia endosymbiont of Chironomus riparius]
MSKINVSLLRRKLIYRSWHRGCKETDIILGNFALKYLGKFSLKELANYEKIVDLDDHELYYYITGQKILPNHLDKKIFNLIALSCTQD